MQWLKDYEIEWHRVTDFGLTCVKIRHENRAGRKKQVKTIGRILKHDDGTFTVRPTRKALSDPFDNLEDAKAWLVNKD